MYLSELFLQDVKGEMTVDEAADALKRCDSQLCAEMGIKEEEVPIDLFLKKDAGGTTVGLNKKGEELRDFWDVYKDFDQEIPEEKKKGMILPDLAKRIVTGAWSGCDM